MSMLSHIKKIIINQLYLNEYSVVTTLNSRRWISQIRKKLKAKKKRIKDNDEMHFSLLTKSEPIKDLVIKYSKVLCTKMSRKCPENMYIVQDEVVDLVLKHTKPFFKESLIFEANPGPGIVTKALLEAGLSYLRVFEKNKEFLPNLEVLKFKYKQLEIVEEDFLKLPYLDVKDTYTGQSTLNYLLKNVPSLSWTNGPPFTMLAVLSPRSEVTFIRYLLVKLPLMTSLFTYGRCQFLFFVSGKEYMYMTAKPKDNYLKYRSVTILYNLLFDLEFLAKIPKQHFLPHSCSTINKKLEYDDSNLYFIRLIPRADLLEKVATFDKLPDLCFFVKQHLMRRKSFVIPSLEKWIPHCGPRLIKEGMPLFTRFGDLSPEEILWVFHLFSSWPEYPESLFRAAVINDLQFSQGVFFPEDEE